MNEGTLPSDLASYSGLGDAVTRELRDQILAGTLAEGERIIERDIAASLRVSRGPVRDAIRQLAVEGLVVTQPRRGTRVASLMADDGEELMTIRAAIEPMAVRFLVQGVEDPYFVPLHRVLESLRVACSKSDWTQAVLQDFALHNQLYQLCGRQRLVQTWNGISAPLLHIFRLNRTLYGSINEIYENHRKLVEDIESGDLEVALGAIRHHVEHFRVELLDMMREHDSAAQEESKAAKASEKSRG